ARPGAAFASGVACIATRPLPPESARGYGPDGASALPGVRRRRQGGRLGLLRDGRALRLGGGPLRGLDEDGGEAALPGGAGVRRACRGGAWNLLPGADPGRHRPPRAASRRVPGGAARRCGLESVGGRVALSRDALDSEGTSRITVRFC